MGRPSPVRVALAAYTDQANNLELNPALVEAWNSDRARAQTYADTDGVDTLSLWHGARVCFTGRPSREGHDELTADLVVLPRAGWQQRAQAAGLRVTNDVAVGLDALVRGDTNAGSAKVAHAIQLGIPVIDYATFETLRDRLIDG